jgi:integrase
MRLYKRNNTWWLDVSVNGQRFRLSLDTTDKRAARAIANKKITQAEQGKLTATSQSFARLAFGEAADKYLASRKMEIASSSYIKEKQLLVRPCEYFQALSLNKISAERLIDYREWRAAQGVGAAMLNMELGVLRRILKRAKLWHTLADDIRPLKQPRTIGRALTPDEKAQLLETASQKPEWQTAFWAAILALKTTMRACEIKALRWRDVNLLNETLTVPKSKTEAGERVIPLTSEAYEVIVQLRARAETFGAVESSHFVFAGFKAVGCFDGKNVLGMRVTSLDPTRPITSWRTAWRKLTRKAKLHGLRFHDLRHHAITELAESETSEQTILAIAGHVDRRMLEHYSHIRLEAKRKALEALSGRNEKGYGTNNGTKTDSPTPEAPILGTKMVGACGFEPQTPTVSR